MRNEQNTVIPQEYSHLSERDAFLQVCCDEMFNLSTVITAENLTEWQSVYDLEACEAFIEDNYNE